MYHKLLLTQGGAAMLFADQAERELLWSSDDDKDFAEEFGDDFLIEDDVREILDFLVEHKYLTDDEADDTVIDEESLSDSGENLMPIIDVEDDEEEDVRS